MNQGLEKEYKGESIWTTRDGRKIAVKDMTDSHLVNTVRFLQRIAIIRAARDRLKYVFGPRSQGEMAMYCWESGLEEALGQTWQDSTDPIFSVMMTEVKCRSLDANLISDADAKAAGFALEMKALGWPPNPLTK